MSGSMFYVPRRSQLPAFVPNVISSLFPSTSSSTSTALPDSTSAGMALNQASTASSNPISSSCSIGVPSKSGHKAGSKSVSSPGSVTSSRFPPALCFPQLTPTPELDAWKIQSSLPSRTLTNLLRASHSIIAIFQPSKDGNSHEASALNEHLCAAYLLGAPASHLRAIFDRSIDKAEPWSESQCEITIDDWQSYLGDVRYQRAFLDFFEDQLVEYGYDWRGVVLDYMFRGDEPLVNGATSAWGAALIRLALAYEFDSAILAMQALTISACAFSRKQASEDASGEQSGPAVLSTSIEDVFKAVATDPRVNGIEPESNVTFDHVLSRHAGLFAAYQDAWDLSRTGHDLAVEKRFEEGHKVVAAAFVASVRAGKTDSLAEYSAPLGTVLALSHAVRVMIPSIPTTQQATVLYIWWQLALAAYISAGCPTVDKNLTLADENATEADRQKNWENVRKTFAYSSSDSEAEEDSSGLVEAVVSSSAEAGGRTLATGQTRKVDYQALMKQMYEARRRREEAEEANATSNGTSTAISHQPLPAKTVPVDECETVPVWAEGTMVTAAWSLRIASWEATATNDHKGTRLFESLAAKFVAQL